MSDGCICPRRYRRDRYAGVAQPTLSGQAEAKIDYSFVIPVKDEEATLSELCGRIREQFGPEIRVEIIFVDDGSTDRSWKEIKCLSEENRGAVRGLRFRRNAGKAAVLTAGFRASKGRIIFTMDADLQDDPKEVHRFLAKLNEGYDLVSGWKRVRHDPWHKVLPSRVFNWMLSTLSRTRLHDHNCGFKCYRAAVPKGLTLYGELHRMIPALAAIDGYRAAELEVEHHPRRHGGSKYGFERYLRGLMDMLTVSFFRRYRERPAHSHRQHRPLLRVSGPWPGRRGGRVRARRVAGIGPVSGRDRKCSPPQS